MLRLLAGTGGGGGGLQVDVAESDCSFYGEYSGLVIGQGDRGAVLTGSIVGMKWLGGL